ncbi:MAG: xanthine dehydrogenase family protein molybdopterin-binding subunit [Planctomycetota bacterium]|mgnify:CR=1 FL=1|nr:MAG: xanthine dehydrogenase family protein molybdopterin-binding subunit [Planctomycetota bacterium]
MKYDTSRARNPRSYDETDRFDIEPERYELFEGPRYQFEPDRRDFLKVLGGGILITLVWRAAEAQDGESGRRVRRSVLSAPQDLEAWLHIADDGRVTIYTGKTEVGQNIRTSLSQVVAEELHVPVESIAMVMADTNLTPYDRGTFGSRTSPSMAPQLRKAAATARELLVDLAAERLGVDRESLVAAEGAVRHEASNRSVAFGALAKDRKLTQRVTSDAETAAPEDWKVAGTPVAKVDARSFVTGSHQYASDVVRPGMLFGKVLRPKLVGATLESIDASKAEAMPGVTVVRDGDFVGVAAPSEPVARQALAAIEAEWKNPESSGEELYARLKRPQEDGGGGGFRRRSGGTRGSIERGMAEAKHRLQSTYAIAYVAHAPLEPRAAVAEWNDGKLTVWTGTQRPFGVQGDLAEAFGMSGERVRVIVPDTGSGYGGKHTGEAALEAARLAKEAGKPVKLVWTREEEFTWAYFRPAGVIEVDAGVDADGKLVAWEFHNYNSGGSAIAPLYEVANQKVQSHRSDAPLRQGSYRALAATANHFARESHIDQLAHAVGQDPHAFRLSNLKDERLRAVLEAAAKRFGWGSVAAEGHGFGIAVGSEKGSYVANCAEVAVDRTTGEVRVVRAVTAFECGTILNPLHLENQVEGAVVMGLGGALFEAIELEGDAVANPRFSRYRVPRFGDMPKLETVLVNRPDLPSAGAGETPIVTIAPAIGNAIFAACGVRLTSMPMVPKGVKV